MITPPRTFCRTCLSLFALILGASGAGAIADLNRLDSLATGNHSFTAGGQTFDAYVANDGGTGWLLIGRGRNGWEFDTDGQGAVADVGNVAILGTPAAFAPALYGDAIVNELITNSGIDLTGVEVRLKRASNPAGTAFQEGRWNRWISTAWTGDLDQGAGRGALVVDWQVLNAELDGPAAIAASGTRDGNFVGGAPNNGQRVFTWAWGGHGNQQGFSYGQSVPGTDGNNPNSFMWELATENHAVPYTEVFIRSLDPPPFGVVLSPREVLSDAVQGDAIGTLSSPLGEGGDTFSYSLVAGDGDADNGKFQIVGDQLRTGAFDFGAASEGDQFTVRIRSVGAPSAQQFEEFLVISLVIQDDTDGDGLLDAWEERWTGAGNLATLSGIGGADADGDMLTDLDEFNLRAPFPDLDPTEADSDGDLLEDGDELAGAGDRPATDPTNADTDGDGLDDMVESNTGIFVPPGDVDSGSDPTRVDTDGDGVADKGEADGGFDPTDANSHPAGITHLRTLNALSTGNHFFAGDGQTFDAYVDNDAGTGWLLVGRGRNGWEFDTDGQGSLTDVGIRANLRSPAAFVPAMYRDAIVDELIANSGVDLTDVEIRIRRAGDPAGTGPYQEARWRPLTQTAWTGDFDFANPGYAVEFEILSGAASPFGPVTTDSYDTLNANVTGNDISRIFTWPWNGHGLQQGFSYGQSAQGVDNNDPNTFLWELGAEGHAMPYTEVFIRLRNPPPAPEEFSITAIDFSPGTSMLALTWQSRPGDAYIVKYSTDMTDWSADLDDGIDADAGATTSRTFNLIPAGLAGAGHLYIRVELRPPG